ncbi:hypothetical protein IAG41_15655 [Sphingomonas sp. JC676]|uniref:hypothetical protein n=1 Tax=Sphingomonas sp. JC676 TaxID=2768065 RepID=UPI0016577BF6|nr:hypothetical protein [Sphingomonas sp. JC676]MBC9033831.1 hypothetical protein [Sphingomonas sp. JC676]
MTDSPSDYYARRAEAERALADKARDPAIARPNRELAKRYDDIVAGKLPPISEPASQA